MTVHGSIGTACYQAARVLLGSAARIYFRRIETRHGDRVPLSGSLLIVANHPASFTDVVVLGAAVPRRLHFLAMAPIFKPWIRGFGLRACGALPVYRREDDPALMGRNQDTFRACHEILDQGGAVLIFPEGTSLTDRQIVRVKTGAARIALGQDARPGQEGKLTLLPIGLHFAERTGFWTDVVISVGRPISLTRFREIARNDSAESVRQLTDEIQNVLEKLILNIPDVDRVALVDTIDRIYRDDLRGTMSEVPALGLARGVVECIERVARTEPERVAATWDRIRAYHETLGALGVHDRAMREMLPRGERLRERLRLVTLGLLGVGPAIVGGLVHYVPYRPSAELGTRATRDPTRLAAFRIAVGIVLFPLTYLALAVALHQGLGWSPRAVAVALLVAIPLGLHARLYFGWLAHQRERIRLVFLRLTQRRLVAHLRRQRRELIAEFDEARRQYLAATGRDPGAA